MAKQTRPPVDPMLPVRRLATILVADASGYGGLMQVDEEGTFKSLRTLMRAVFAPAISRHNGRLVKTTGDGLLAEFASPVEAVRCAIWVQTAIAGGSGEQAAPSDLRFRIGINLGDILSDGDDIFGDGVNVAARLERLAEPGGICLSAAVHDLVKDRLDVRFGDLGERAGKLRERPIHAFRVEFASPGGGRTVGAPHSAEVEAPEAMPEVRGRPRIAVLRFATAGSQLDDEEFAETLAEDIVRLLGRNRWLEVLSQAGSHFAGHADAGQMATALGLRYLVRGRIRRRGDETSLAAELIDGTTGGQVWSETFDLGDVDLHEVRDRIAQQIAAMVEPDILRLEQHRAIHAPLAALDAWGLYHRGYWNLWTYTRTGLAEARRLFEMAVAADPDLARAHAGLSHALLQAALYGSSEERPTLLAAALDAAERAAFLDDRDSHGLTMLGRVFCLLGRYADSIAVLEEAIALNPSHAQARFALAFTFVWCGRAEEAIALLDRAVELSPRDPQLWNFHHVRAMAHFALAEYDVAESFAREAIRQPTATYYPYALLVSLLGLTGRPELCPEAIGQLRRKRPAYSLRTAADFFLTFDAGLAETFLTGLRLAGVPEAPLSSPDP
nr:tetratricopeptide repeat protein [Aurantimonas sp. VKM B-3413]